MKLALYLINGPLGAGKTTLLKYLLSTAQFADARVVENEYASQSVDTQQLALHSAEVKTIADVCICCSTGRELTVALEELAEQSSAPVIIEATGVANSLVLVEKLAAAQLLDYYELRHAVFVLDAAEAQARPELLAMYRDELAAADTVALSKTDLLEPEDVLALVRQLDEVRDGRIENMVHGQLDIAVFEQPSAIIEYYLNHESAARDHEHEPSYTIIPTRSGDISPELLRSCWPQFVAKYGVERMKGALVYEDSVWHVEATPSQCIIEKSNDPDETLSLVLIGAEARQITEAVFAQEVAV